ncbi:hypothetical protein GQ54DRAFT_298203 [Martensiomyces pterosporus]|nr:hypothetical protein GQ54DRAFT_298203 [Martensiomyces pterosporus]
MVNCIFIFAFFALSVFGISQGDLRRREVTSATIGSVVGAVLVKNGYQTSCEIVPIDNRAGFIAASCLDFQGSQLANDTVYQIYLDNSLKTVSAQHTIEAIHVHPMYDASTFANNIAIVEFNTQAQKLWNNYIALDRNSWTNLTYVRRTMVDASAMFWAPHYLDTRPQQSARGCKSASPVYAPNTSDFLCGNWSAQPVLNAACSMPFGSVIAFTGDDMAVAAIYSHSATSGKSICADKSQLHYYTLLTDYVMFACKVLRRSMDVYTRSPSYRPNTDADYMMRPASPAPTAPEITIYGGDAYPHLGLKQPKVNTNSAALATQLSTLSAITTSSATLPTATITPLFEHYSRTRVATEAMHRQDVSVMAGVIVVLALTPLAIILCCRWLRKEEGPDGHENHEDHGDHEDRESHDNLNDSNDFSGSLATLKGFARSKLKINVDFGSKSSILSGKTPEV